MDYKLSPVSLDRIETTDQTFKITTATDETDLVHSIALVGLLQPPVIIEKGRRVLVICGFRRIAACAALKMSTILARVLPPDTAPLACAQMAIADNLHQRPLNTVEQSRAYVLVRKCCPDSDPWLKTIESIGLPSGQMVLERIMPVAEMPVSLQEAILDGSIALPVATMIDQMNADDGAACCQLLRRISAGLNVQRELLTMISEITLRDGTTITRLLEQPLVADVLKDDERPTPQKVQWLRMYFKTRRYPELSQAEIRFREAVKALKLNSRVQLQPPPFFEGKTYRLTLTVDSRRQLKTLQSELSKLADHPHLLPE